MITYIPKNLLNGLLLSYSHAIPKSLYEIEFEIDKLKSLVGKERTEELIIEIKNEAFSNSNVINGKYILARLRQTKEKILSGTFI